MKNLLRSGVRSVLWPYRDWTMKRAHRRLHNDNDLFYTLSPSLLMAITIAFQIQAAAPQWSKAKWGYYEFGLFKGFSFWFAEQLGRQYPQLDFHYYGFESFEGLPKTEVDHNDSWAPGNYASSIEFVQSILKKHKTDFAKITLHKGWFSKPFFDQLKQDHTFPRASICVIDSDLYESCSSVLHFMKDLLAPDTILLFDEYNQFSRDDSHGERRAMREFQAANPHFQMEPLFEYGSAGMAFRVKGL